LASLDGLGAERFASDGPRSDLNVLAAETGPEQDSSTIGSAGLDGALDSANQADSGLPDRPIEIEDAGQGGPPAVDAVDAPEDSSREDDARDSGALDTRGAAEDGAADAKASPNDPDAARQDAGWIQVATKSPQHYYPGTAYDPALQRAVLFGGHTNCSETFATNQTWEWDGTAWTKVTPNGLGPSPRGSMGITFDRAHGEAIIQGGWAQPNNLQTGTYTYGLGTHTWTFLVGPPNLEWGALGYDTDADLVRMFGGSDTFSFFRNVRFWNATTLKWQDVATTGPTARARHAWVFDQAHHLFVMFGGVPNWSGARLSDTWEYDPATKVWQQTATTGVHPTECDVPPPMAYDPVRQLVVMYCDLNGGETWEYDAGQHTWAKALGGSQVGAISGASMFYDDQLQSALLVGGCKNGSLQDATWRYIPAR
jgi:hypothetical protein